LTLVGGGLLIIYDLPVAPATTVTHYAF
jgi:hypothetical protein